MARIEVSLTEVKLQRSRSKDKICCYPKEELETRNTSMKYESPSAKCSKVMPKVQVFEKWVKLLGQGKKYTH